MKKVGLLIFALLLTVNCAGTVPQKGSLPPITEGAKVDTLCFYFQRHSPSYNKGPYYEGTYLFRDSAHLAEFLDSTGYHPRDGDDTAIKHITHQPDFKKWTYFGLTGHAPTYGCAIDVSYGEDTVTIILTQIITVYPKRRPGDPVSKPADRAIVYFIPFTEKTIVFTAATKYVKGEKQRHRKREYVRRSDSPFGWNGR